MDFPSETASYYPRGAAHFASLRQIIRYRDKIKSSDRLSTRLVKSACVLERDDFIGWQIHVPQSGVSNITVFGSDTVGIDDLLWVAEGIARTDSRVPTKAADLAQFRYLYELKLPINVEKSSIGIGFASSGGSRYDDYPIQWPLSYASQFADFVKALKKTGGIFRVVLGAANSEEIRGCRKMLSQTWSNREMAADEYLGTPVRTRSLLLLPVKPSIRLRAVLEEAISETELSYIGDLQDASVYSVWNTPLDNASVLPDYAARILCFEPFVSRALVGVDTCEEGMSELPASFKNTKDKHAITLGRAIDATGSRRKILIGEKDLRRHMQIVGQTGTGKSSLLAQLIVSAIKEGYGLTFFDPHGTTIDVIMRAVPEEYAERIRVVHIGDSDNPVPLNMWDSDDPQNEERTISDLCELFSDIFDPRKEGIVGPRYERWLSTFCKASIALLGRRASLQSITILSQSQENMLHLYDAIKGGYPELAEIIKNEYGKDKSNDFNATLSWYLSKFERLTSVEQLRKTLGAGYNALDFKNSIDTNTVTLIDLASPVIGTHAARIVGTLTLLKLWNAAMERKRRDLTHLVFVDEASLFQTNPMPRMLAEARKFGLSLILCTQHTGQLSFEIREALEANSANFCCFRTSTKDAALAAIRFDNPDLQVDLTRLDAFYAVTSISVDGKQTDPFTMYISKPTVQKTGEEIAARIEQQSREKLVEPYRELAALTPAEILTRLKGVEEDDSDDDYVILGDSQFPNFSDEDIEEILPQQSTESLSPDDDPSTCDPTNEGHETLPNTTDPEWLTIWNDKWRDELSKKEEQP